MIKYFIKGGFMMWPLLACSIFSFGVIIERSMYFRYLGKIYKKIARSLSGSFEKKNVEQAYAICKAYHIPLTRILITGLVKMKQGKDAVDAVLEETTLDQLAFIEKRLPILSTIASISTLLGFTGTVTGMIVAFQAIAREGISSPTIVASGISEALITTAAGLLIAIPTVVAYHFFSHRADYEIKIIQKYSKELLSFFE